MTKKTILKATGFTILGLIATPLLILQITKYALRPREEPGSKLLIPLEPHPNDDSYSFMKNLEVTFDDQDRAALETCGDSDGKPAFDKQCLTLLKKFSGPLDKFQAWRIGQAPHGFKRDKSLQRHSRAPLYLPERLPSDDSALLGLKYLKLTRLFLLRMRVALQEGNKTRVLESWQGAVDLSRLLGEQYDMIHQMLSIAVLGISLRNVTQYVPASQTAKYRFETYLPTSAEIKENMELTLGGEWLFQKDVIENRMDEARDMSISQLKWASWLGFYDRPHLLASIAGEIERLTTHLKGDRMEMDSYQSPSWATGWGRFGISLFHDPMGRVLTLDGTAAFPKYVAKTGEGIDKIQAFHIVMAARRYYVEKSKWPQKEADLVPAYLKEWPKSALNGQPMKFQGADCSVQILSINGDIDKKGPDWFHCKLPGI